MQIITSIIPIEPPKEYTLILSQEELDLVTFALDAQKNSLKTEAANMSLDMLGGLKALSKNRDFLLETVVQSEATL